MRTQRVLCGAVLFLACGSPPVAAAGTTIVVNSGRFPTPEAAAFGENSVEWTDGETADDTACTECFAAVELQRYLRQMTGREQDFPLSDDDHEVRGGIILVGGTASNAASRRLASQLGVDAASLSALGPEGYRIKSAEVGGCSVLLVAGGGRVGTLYAAYDLLYRLGCRWFGPGSLHEEVPRVERLASFDVTERPSLHARGFLAWEARGNADFLLWMARNRMNYWCVEQNEHALMRKLGIAMVCGLHDAQALFLNPSSAYPYNHPEFAGDQQRPKDPYPVSPQFQGDADRDGKLSYFEAHPEWFALAGGRRIPGIQGSFGTNYCTSNPDATREFLGNYVQALIDGPYRDADWVRFWTLDAGKWCACEACKSLGTPTDRYLLLVHQMNEQIKAARAAGKIHRPIRVAFLAYADVLDPPSRPLPAGFDYENCAATFYPIVRCYLHRFDDDNCPANRRYRQQLEGWATRPSRHYRGQIAIGEYYNVSGYKCLPICFMHTMAADIPFYHRAGARCFDYMHVTTGHWGNKCLTNYQMARQLWDVGTDCEVLWRDYFQRRYGSARATMRAFYESLENMLANVSELKYGLARRLNRGEKELFPTPHLRWRREPGVACDGMTLEEILEHSAACRRLIDEALRMELPARIKDRIAEDERMFTYGERTVAYYAACVESFAAARSSQFDKARAAHAEAQRLANLLRADTISTSLSSSHASAPDAFTASNATGALDQVLKLLESKPPGPK